MVFYVITCLQCALQTTLTFQALIHFTDWVVGHAHLVMFGVFSMWLLGIMTYLFPRLLAHRVVQPRTVRVALLALGRGPVRDGRRPDLWPACSRATTGLRSQPWEVSVEGSQPFWILRVFAGLAMMAGQGCFFYNLYMTWRKSRADGRAGGRRRSAPSRRVTIATQSFHLGDRDRMFESKSGVLLIAGLGFFAFAFLSNALVPALMYRQLARSHDGRTGREEQQPDVSVRGPEPSLSRAVRQVLSARPPQEKLRRGAAIWDGRSTRAKAAGTATASSCGRSRARRIAGDPSRKTEEYQNDLAAAGHVRHAARRSRPVARRRPPGERLARRAFLPAHDGVDRFAHARVSLVFRRRARSSRTSAGWR